MYSHFSPIHPPSDAVSKNLAQLHAKNSLPRHADILIFSILTGESIIRISDRTPFHEISNSVLDLVCG